ncbi:MAG: FAD-dependent oxidoreductase [Thermoanaerobaculia bacterium]|nr:FAD-dependent oxidoreductase [Thermoanaerobaculia bacterium]
MKRPRIVILGAGPAGLGAAHRLAGRGLDVVVLEKRSAVGGNAGSFVLDGIPVDYGSHRLHRACSPEILADIRSLLGDDLLTRPRNGRIRLGGRWLRFPLRPLDLAANLPPKFVLGVLRDTVRPAPTPAAEAESFEAVLERKLGRTICREFYFPYARKLWGIAPAELDAEQARRRVSAGSVVGLARKAVGRIAGGAASEDKGSYFYPRGGFGRISQAYRRSAESKGASIRLEAQVERVELEDAKVTAVDAVTASGPRRFSADAVLSTIPVPVLVSMLDPSVDETVRKACRALRYRAMVLVYLVLEADRFSAYDAHYFPATAIAVSRLSEPKNYGLADVSGTTVLCAELPCSLGDAVWGADDDALGELVLGAMSAAGLPVRSRLVRVVTKRLSHAYPIYERGYSSHLSVLETAVARIDGLVTLGRQGLFAHDNTHHTLAMAYAASDCVDSEGLFDEERWSLARREFDRHVVED